jgi:hypothetical protein
LLELRPLPGQPQKLLLRLRQLSGDSCFEDRVLDVVFPLQLRISRRSRARSCSSSFTRCSAGIGVLSLSVGCGPLPFGPFGVRSIFAIACPRSRVLR